MGRGKDFDRGERRNFEQDEPIHEPAWTISPRLQAPAPSKPQSSGVTHAGTVKRFDAVRGFGFIKSDDGGLDIFVHISAVKRAGLSGLDEGQLVEYELADNRGKTCAENLRIKPTP
jgi:CspA family cold shock protein